MTLQARDWFRTPEETTRVAQAAFPSRRLGRSPSGRSGPEPNLLEVRSGVDVDRLWLSSFCAGAFRERLDQGGAEQQLLDDMLKQFGDQGLLKARGPQRTDSTHVVAAIRELNRVECIGETMRHALNNLAAVVPPWLREQVSPDWFDLYGPRFDMEKQLPTGCERYRLWTSCVECGSSGSCGMESVWDCDKGEVCLHLQL